MRIFIAFFLLAVAFAREEKNCVDEPETGLCRAYFPSWYYDQQSGSCKEFVYGGCGGNGNRYTTEQECMGHCGRGMLT
ncbi:putative serine proteinase inhibitor [Caerostris extrusa]|uniref:Serine proteinase inhibitor n=1 Tax=Caerostris extrusa TaxID=172846 RepID=A0AAV4W7J5_CAEEX|nr:putative serine proteinase inhibitor [Caerostris extrusa]